MAGWTIRRILEAVRVLPPPGFSTGKILINGVVPAAYAAGDALGTQWAISVPIKRLRLQCATIWDLSDLNLQVNLTIADAPFDTQIADNAAFSPSDADGLRIVHQVEFIIFTDWINNRASFIEQIDKKLHFPSGIMYLQAFVPAAQTIAAGAVPVIQLDFDPDE